MKTQTLVKKLKKIEWDKYCVRPYPFFMWSYFFEVYHSYDLFTTFKFDYLMVFAGRYDKIYYRQSAARKKMENYFEERFRKLAFLKNYVRKQKKSILPTFDYDKEFVKKHDLGKYSDKKLLKLFNEFIDHNTEWAGALSSSILLLPKLSNYIEKEFLLPKLVKRGEEKKVNEIMGYFSLANKESHFITEEKELLKLAAKKKHKEFDKLLDRHVKKWSIMSFASSHKLLTKQDFFNRIKGEKHPLKKLKQMTAKEKEQQKTIKSIYKKYGFSKKEQEVIDTMRSMLYHRSLEELVFCHQEFIFLKFFKEIAKRRHIPFNHAKFLIIPEIRQALAGEKIDTADLAKRKASSMVVFIKGKQYVYSGKQAEKFFKIFVKEEAPKRFSGLLEGQCGSPGKVTGKVRVIHHSSDLDKLEKGEVMVTAATNPAYVIAMKKAKAIVTDEGGITCHAAIVSRELKKPCVIGTKHATLFLKTGDKVTIDAIDGKVKKVKK